MFKYSQSFYPHYKNEGYDILNFVCFKKHELKKALNTLKFFLFDYHIFIFYTR